jgi:ferredoxin
VWEGHDLKIGRNRREFKALDKEDLDYNAISYDNIGRQVPGIKKANIGSKHDERITFTEEQVRNETARCLGCGATIVDENRCIGCGVCTTRCKFDAIHLVKKFDAPTRSVHNRKKYIENYRKERNDKIAIKKISK